MIIYINDRPCEAQVGDLLLNAAKQNKAHIGYICGGNGICQSCFVYVREGADCLSQPSDEEKAFISDKLFQEGGRLACQTVIVKEGTIRVISRAETLRRLVLGLNIPGFITYAQTIGYNVVNKLPSGAANIVSRVQAGRLNPIDTIGKIASGFAPASQLAMNNLVETLPFMQGPLNLVGGVARGATDMIGGVAGGVVNTVSGVAGGAFNALGGVAGGALNTIGSAAGGVLNAVGGVAGGAFNALGGVAGGAFNTIGSAAGGALDTVNGLLCAVTGGMLHLPGASCAIHNAPKTAIERVTITARP